MPTSQPLLTSGMETYRMERMRGVALLHTVRVYPGSDHAGFELKGVRYLSRLGHLSREHNDAQVVGVGARMHGPAGAAEIVEAFLATPFFDSERSARRIRLISDFEATGDTPPISAG